MPLGALAVYLVSRPTGTTRSRLNAQHSAQLLKRSSLALPFHQTSPPASTPVNSAAVSPPASHIDARSPAWLQEGPYAPMPTMPSAQLDELKADRKKQEEIREAFEVSLSSIGPRTSRLISGRSLIGLVEELRYV